MAGNDELFTGSIVDAFTISFNVYNGGPGTPSAMSSSSGHANVTFTNHITNVETTIGANANFDLNGFSRNGVMDGFIQDETGLWPRYGGGVVSRSVPVTQEQFEAILGSAQGLIGTRYDYSLNGVTTDAATCAAWAQRVYAATGHPGSFGDLFSIDEMQRVPGFIWIYVGTLGSVRGDGPLYIPVEPIWDHSPDTSLLSLRCFPAHTRIQTSRTTSTAISALRVGDVVLAFDARADKGRGALVPRRVTQAYRNTTTDWIRLRWFDGTAREVITTPGPHFLDEFEGLPTPQKLVHPPVGFASAHHEDASRDPFPQDATATGRDRATPARGSHKGPRSLHPAPSPARSRPLVNIGPTPQHLSFNSASCPKFHA